MLSVHSEQPNKTGFPTVHALVLLEGTMNLTGETQPLVEQLMMVKRMQVGGRSCFSVPRLCARGRILLVLSGDMGFLYSWWKVHPCLVRLCRLPSRPWLSRSCVSPSVTRPDPRGACRGEVGDRAPLTPGPGLFLQHIPTPLFVLEIWKACLVGLIESPEGTEELKWTAFTFLKVPGRGAAGQPGWGWFWESRWLPGPLPRVSPAGTMPSRPGPPAPVPIDSVL